MLRLVKNDLVANGVSLLGLFLLLNAGLIFTLTRRVFHPEAPFMFGLLIAIVTPLPALLRSEVYKGAVIYRSLPIRSLQIASAKYFSALATIAATVLYTVLYLIILDSGKHPTHLSHSLYQIRFALMAETLFGSGVIALGVPLVIRFGSFMRIIWGIVILIVIHNLSFRFLKNCAIQAANIVGINGTIVCVSALFVVVSLISMLISTRLVRVKEF